MKAPRSPSEKQAGLARRPAELPDLETLYQRIEALPHVRSALLLRYVLGQAVDALSRPETPAIADRYAARMLELTDPTLLAIEKAKRPSDRFGAFVSFFWRAGAYWFVVAIAEAVVPGKDNIPYYRRLLEAGTRSLTAHSRKGQSRRRGAAGRKAEIAAYAEAKRRQNPHFSIEDACRSTARHFGVSPRTVRRAIADAKIIDS